MSSFDEVAPNLVDASAKIYLANALHKSHNIRVKYHSIIWNGGILFICLFFLGAFLYYRYTHKQSSIDRQYKLISDQEYVLSKIRYFQEQNRRIQESAKITPGAEITGLPVKHDFIFQ